MLRGTVTDGKSPVEFATVDIRQGEQWAMTDQQGRFAVRVARMGKALVRVTCIGYEPLHTTIDIRQGIDSLRLTLQPTNLQLQQVVVTAQRRTENATTSYVIDRQALDNQQIVNVSDIMTLLPGGKTVNSSLMTDSRIALHAQGGEKGNAAFGTAVEVDGQRLQNNAEMGETTGVSTRTVSSTNVASIEVVPGIPSVEYGDLSNGIVKVNTKRGHTPWEVSLGTNPYTKQVAVSKGFDMHHGVLNASLEHSRSYSNLASPHTAYQRNTLSLNYRTTTHLAGQPLMVNLNLGGNVGGYNSKADPDQFVDTYSKTRDRVLRGGLQLDWNLDRPWLAALSLHADLSLADKLRTSQVNDNSSSAQAQIHARDEGYYIATDYDQDPNAPIILGPTGYWYVKSYRDNKPQSFMLKLKARWHQQGRTLNNRVMAGVEWTATGNKGRGAYYDDMRTAPTWREYRYDQLPWMHNIALYGEDRLTIDLGGSGSQLQLMAGLRADITRISHSDYGTVASLSPRFNAKYILWRGRDEWAVNGLNVYGGWGKSVKLPSFEVLYPAPAYADRLAFVPGSTVDNRAFYAYSVTPFKPVYNPDLKWQYAQQLELGVEAETRVAGNVPAEGYVVGDVTMTATNGNSNTYLRTGSYLIIDENGTITFKASDGRAITGIVFTDKSGKFMLTAEAGNGILTDHTWTGNSTAVTLTSAVNDLATKTWLVDATVTTDEANADTYTPVEAPTVCDNIAAFIALEPGKSGKLMLNNARVGYVDWNSTYIEDETGAIELYKVRALQLTTGGVLNGSVVLKRSQLLIYDEQVEEEEPGREKPEAAADALTTADDLTITAVGFQGTVQNPHGQCYFSLCSGRYL